jgi:four helix bundle protein
MMSRDHRNLRVFQDAHRLVLAIYRPTGDFPREERFGLRSQLRRAAVSVTSNLVEGNARSGTAEYVHFLNIALGSACELAYLARLCQELAMVPGPDWHNVLSASEAIVRQLERLVQRMEMEPAKERQPRRP